MPNIPPKSNKSPCNSTVSDPQCVSDPQSTSDSQNSDLDPGTFYDMLFDESAFVVTAEELRQFIYCPRIPFFRNIRKIIPKSTYAMENGSNYHQRVIYAGKSSAETRELLRKIAPVSTNTQQYHDVYLESPTLHLGARLDFFEQTDQDLYPVEIKTGIKPQEGRAKHHYIQLTAQALLLEEKFNCLVNRARVVYLQSHDTEWLEIDLTLKQLVLRAITRMEKMYRSEICPNVTPDEGKCVVCEFKPYCYRI